MSERHVRVLILANGRHCARDCPHFRTFLVDGSEKCALFGCHLRMSPKPPDRYGLRRILRAAECRKAEIQEPTHAR